tara:strand:+ start:129 stop:389 length:261 start_codon:yes stop_codon:yes gene_type:complete
VIFTFTEDPGHAWLPVKRSLLKELGVADVISSYSYQEGDTVWLEEDCDAGVFIRAWKQANPDQHASYGSEYVEDTHIRALPHYGEE